MPPPAAQQSKQNTAAPSTFVHGVDATSLSRIMQTDERREHVLRINSSGTPGYRPPPFVNTSQKSQPLGVLLRNNAGSVKPLSIREQMREKEYNRAAFIEHSKKHNVFSGIAMMMDTLRSMDSFPSININRNAPGIPWEQNVHHLGKRGSSDEIVKFLLDSKPLRQPKVFKDLSDLMVRGLKEDPAARFSAKQAAKHDFFMYTILTEEEQAITSAEGIPVEGGEAYFFPGEQLKQVHLVLGGVGLGAESIEGYEEGELVCFYTGEECLDGAGILSKHVFTLEHSNRWLNRAEAAVLIYFGKVDWLVSQLQQSESKSFSARKCLCRPCEQI